MGKICRVTRAERTVTDGKGVICNKRHCVTRSNTVAHKKAGNKRQDTGGEKGAEWQIKSGFRSFV